MNERRGFVLRPKFYVAVLLLVPAALVGGLSGTPAGAMFWIMDGWHDSQLGRTRRALWPAEDDDVGQALHDFDPFV